MDKKQAQVNQNRSVYHSTLRNVGLYFTLSLGIITLSSNKVIKDPFINMLLNIIGIIFLYISYSLTLELDNTKDKEGITDSLLNINKILKNVMLLLLIIMIYSLFIIRYTNIGLS